MYAEPDSSEQVTVNNGSEDEDDDEEVSFAHPSDMGFSSDLKFTRKNIEAMEEYLKKAEVFHHLWVREDETADMRKAILLYRDVKQREDEHKKQMELVSDLRDSL